MADLRVAIVDDDPVLLAELPTLLEPEGIDVVWTATNAADAGRKLSAGERLPDVLVVDVRMPGISGHEFANTVRALHPGLPIVMYTSVDSGDSMRDALECGASGYLVKHDPPERVSLLLRLAAMGQPVFSEAPGQRLAEDFTSRVPAVERITVRQYEVLRLVAQGHSNDAVAKRLGCSAETVKKHLRVIFERLGASDRASAVATAIRAGLS